MMCVLAEMASLFTVEERSGLQTGEDEREAAGDTAGDTTSFVRSALIAASPMQKPPGPPLGEEGLQPPGEEGR